MPATATDRQVLTACAAFVAVGIALTLLGILLEPPLALLRHLTKEH